MVSLWTMTQTKWVNIAPIWIKPFQYREASVLYGATECYCTYVSSSPYSSKAGSLKQYFAHKRPLRNCLFWKCIVIWMTHKVSGFTLVCLLSQINWTANQFDLFMCGQTWTHLFSMLNTIIQTHELLNSISNNHSVQMCCFAPFVFIPSAFCGHISH